MSKSVNDLVLDASLEYLLNHGVKMTVCETEPTTYEQANSNKGTGAGKVLANVAMESGDYAIASVVGGAGGRKITMSEKADVTVDITGDADHVAIVDTVNEVLLYVTTCTQQTLTAANTVTFPSWTISLSDPV
jgi:hypothetical protein